MPDRRTERAFIYWAHRAVAGLLLWFLARPAGRTEKNAFECAVIYTRMWGRLPLCEEQRKPTCSALEETSIGILLIVFVFTSV